MRVNNVTLFVGYNFREVDRGWLFFMDLLACIVYSVGNGHVEGTIIAGTCIHFIVRMAVGLSGPKCVP